MLYNQQPSAREPNLANNLKTQTTTHLHHRGYGVYIPHPHSMYTVPPRVMKIQNPEYSPVGCVLCTGLVTYGSLLIIRYPDYCICFMSMVENTV